MKSVLFDGLCGVRLHLPPKGHVLFFVDPPVGVVSFVADQDQGFPEPGAQFQRFPGDGRIQLASNIPEIMCKSDGNLSSSRGRLSPLPVEYNSKTC